MKKILTFTAVFFGFVSVATTGLAALIWIKGLSPAKVKSLETEIRVLRGKKSNFTNKKQSQELENEIRKIKDQVKFRNHKISDLEEQISTAKVDIEDSRTVYKVAKKGLNDAQITLTQLLNEKINLQRHIRGAIAKLDRLNRELEVTVIAKEGAHAHALVLKEDVRIAEKELTRLHLRMRGKQEQLRKLRTNLKWLADIIRAEENKSRKKDEEIRKLNEHLRKLHHVSIVRNSAKCLILK